MSRRFIIALLLAVFAFIQVPAQRAQAAEPIEFVQEKLDNGLNVIYAPLRRSDTKKPVAPVVHVRVLYHVGSRDERPDRQGFAHMFEHMMFRGSEHVKAEEHMKLIGIVGGNSNAFTSFDQTTYVNTIPSSHLEMALYLEADRMASFKVSEDIYKVERNVVAKEWGIRQNQPYGTLFEDYLRTAYTKHPYRWTPIGNMEHLKAAPVNELQAFFNKYYVPNNATLIIAGDVDVEKAKEWVHKYYAWIPAGPHVAREIQQEPEQSEPRRIVAHKQVPLPAVVIGYHTAEYKSDDHFALSILGSILGDGRSSRLDRLLVSSAQPLAVSASTNNWQLEDKGIFAVIVRLLPGKKVEDVEKLVNGALNEVIEKGISAEELEKARTQARIALIRGRETATEIATQLGEEAVFGGDANRVNTALDRLMAVKAEDVQAVAKKYFQPQRATTLQYIPDPTGKAARAAAQEAAQLAAAPVAPGAPVQPRAVKFPENYPQRPPMAQVGGKVEFAKGTEFNAHGVRVIVMPDSRLPLVNWALTMRRGSHSEPAGKDGLGSLTASLLRRGSAGMSYEQLNQDLESRGITVEVFDGGDFTRVGGSSTTDQLEHGLTRTRQVLLEPTFPQDEFTKLKNQTIAGLTTALSNPASVADRELQAIVFGDSPLGRSATPQTVSNITLDDIKQYYKTIYRPQDAFLVFSGDITVDRAKALADKLLSGWETGTLPNVQYNIPPVASKRKILLVDNPDAKQSVIRMGVRAYDIRTDEKFAGSLAGTLLSAGIDSRLGRYVRAEKGYAYGVRGYFRPGRQAGVFDGTTETAFDTTAATIEAMFKVFNDLRSAPVGAEELKEAQNRVAGGMVMDMQTIGQQAGRRVDSILNDYPADYYDRYAERIAQVTPQQIKDVAGKYILDDKMAIVVVAPAAKVKEQLEKLGDVEVVPMPLNRPGAPAKPDNDLLRSQPPR